MVLPLVDENKPRCFYCYEGFENIEKLREHQKIMHKLTEEEHGKNTKREPAPGDITVF